MSRKKIRFIIGLMAVALVALVSFQMYWINLAINVKNERFNQSVHEAMEAVVKGLEKQEILYLAGQRIKLAEKRRAEARAAEVRRLALKKERSLKTNTCPQRARPVPHPSPTDAQQYLARMNSWQQLFPEAMEWKLTITDGFITHPNAGENGWNRHFQTLETTRWGVEPEPRPSRQVYAAPSERQDTRFEYHFNDAMGFSPGKPRQLLKRAPEVHKRGKKAGPKDCRSATEGSLAWNIAPGVTVRYPDGTSLSPDRLGAYFEPHHRSDSLIKVALKHLKSRRSRQDSLLRLTQPTLSVPEIVFWSEPFEGQAPLLIQSSPRYRPTPAPKAARKAKASGSFGEFYANLDTVESIKTSFKENFDKVEKKAEVMQDVFNALVTVKRKIDSRINQRMLDSLLHKEIRNRGIDIPFEYGVHAQQNNRVMFASLGGTPDRLMTSPFRVSLFPNDLNCEGNYLLVNFPGQKHYIFQKLGVVFLSSAVLILVIIACFYVAITTILKQKKLSEVKNDFINNMTHEFKTPIATISLACEVLQETSVSTDPAKRNRYLNVIHDENKRLGLQVEKVLQTALLDKGTLKLKLSQVNIHEVIDNALQNIGVQIEQRQGHIQLDLEAKNAVVEADEVHVTNLVHNLLDNANKYSPHCPSIIIKTRSGCEGVYLTVADRGIGMTKEALQRIFERFYRVPTGNIHNVKGFGLGLSYVKTILQMHHGNIRVESQPHKGSSFEIFLPYTQG